MICWERFFRSAGVIVLLTALFSLGQAAFPGRVYAAAQESRCGDGVCETCELDTCLEDCPPAVTCGDGVCSAFEDYQNCFLDCLPPSPTLTPTNTPTPTLTTIPSSPTITMSPGDSITNTPSVEPTLASSTPTMRPTVMPLANNSTPEPTPMPVPPCREVALGEISRESVDAFVTTTEGTLTGRWMICNTPLTEMCLPSAPRLPETQIDLAAVHLLDCHRTGQCDVYNTFRLEDGRVCVDLENVEQAPDCSEGCAWAVMEQAQTPVNLPISVVLIISGLMGSIAILHVAYPVQVDDESNSSADTSSP